jgi:hypothetical protein
MRIIIRTVVNDPRRLPFEISNPKSPIRTATGMERSIQFAREIRTVPSHPSNSSTFQPHPPTPPFVASSLSRFDFSAFLRFFHPFNPSSLEPFVAPWRSLPLSVAKGGFVAGRFRLGGLLLAAGMTLIPSVALAQDCLQWADRTPPSTARRLTGVLSTQMAATTVPARNSFGRRFCHVPCFVRRRFRAKRGDPRIAR